jgi:hypothetical protein
MKALKVSSLVLVTLFFFSPKHFSQTTFEGKVVIETTNDGETNTLNYYSKGEMARFDVNSARGEANIIFDKEHKKMLMVMPTMKMYMEFPLDMELGEDNGNNTGDEKSNTDFVKTSETKTINGYKCEKWVIKDDGKTSEAWMTKDLGGFIFFQSPMGKQAKQKWQEDIENSGYFPMLVVEKDSDGKETGRFEVKSVEKKSLDDSFFAVPAGYNQMKMPMGGQGK